MIKVIQTLTLTLLLLSFVQTPAWSQKFGHINSQAFISEMPAAKQVDKDLVIYRDQLVAATDKIQMALDQKAKIFEADYADGKFSRKIAEETYAVLEKEQQAIFQRRQEDEQKMLKKREQVFMPIFNQVEKAIKEIGKEQGYTFIFDSSYYNAILYIESEDISAAVRKKLGI